MCSPHREEKEEQEEETGNEGERGRGGKEEEKTNKEEEEEEADEEAEGEAEEVAGAVPAPVLDAAGLSQSLQAVVVHAVTQVARHTATTRRQHHCVLRDLPVSDTPFLPPRRLQSQELLLFVTDICAFLSTLVQQCADLPNEYHFILWKQKSIMQINPMICLAFPLFLWKTPFCYNFKLIYFSWNKLSPVSK